MTVACWAVSPDSVGQHCHPQCAEVLCLLQNTACKLDEACSACAPRASSANEEHQPVLSVVVFTTAQVLVRVRVRVLALAVSARLAAVDLARPGWSGPTHPALGWLSPAIKPGLASLTRPTWSWTGASHESQTT